MDRMIKRLVLLLGVAATVGACATQDVELPVENPNGADMMKQSPCACVEYEYDTQFIQTPTG